VTDETGSKAVADAERLRDEVAEQIEFLSRFRADILAHFNGQDDGTVRSRINRGMNRAKILVAEAGVSKSVTLSPPPAIGGLIVRNADPFSFILEDYYGMSMAPAVADMIEEAIGVFESPDYVRRYASALSETKLRKTRSAARGYSQAEHPKLPDRITISWLVQNVPIRFWFWLVGLLAAAVAAGMKWGPLIIG
jgi:hypothetical protein